MAFALSFELLTFLLDYLFNISFVILLSINSLRFIRIFYFTYFIIDEKHLFTLLA